MKNFFNERIRKIGDEALEYIRETLGDKWIEIPDKEDHERLYVNAFTFDGDPFETVVATIWAGEIDDWNGNTYSLGDLSNQSVARIADYVEAHLGDIKDGPGFSVKVGDMIQYRVNIVEVLKVEDDGVWVRGPYGEEQKIDWEDVKEYNK